MKKQIFILLIVILFFSSFSGLTSVSAATDSTSRITYDTASFTETESGWDTTELQSETEFEIQNFVQLSPGAAMWQGIPITDALTSPQIGDRVNAEVTFITHSNITNTNNVLIRVVGRDQHLVEISSISEATPGKLTTLQAGAKHNNSVVPDETDTLWIELHNDTDGILEIQSIKLWGERNSEIVLYQVPNSDFMQSFSGNWDYNGTININKSIYMESGVAAWRSLPLSADNNSPQQGDIVLAQVDLFIPEEVTANDHVYLRLNDGAFTLIDVKNITDLPRNQWVTVTGQVMENGAQISDTSTLLWITIYNDSNSSIRMKNIRVEGIRSNTSIYDLNQDGFINVEDLALIQAAYDNDEYSLSMDFDKDGQLTEKDIIFFKKFALQQSNLLYINLDHFLFMNEQVEIDDIPMLITHLYSEPIDRNNLSLGYKWVGDPQEGFAAVDDVARAVTAFVEHYRLYGDATSYENIKLGLQFLMWMQYEDGDYDNFVVQHENGTIEKKDSYSSNKSFSWWALRAYEAMAEAYPIIKDEDMALKNNLKSRLDLNLQRLTELTAQHYGETFSIGDSSYASWMLGGDAWLTANAINSLYVHHKIANPSTQSKIETLAQQLGEALILTQQGSFTQFPYGGFMHIIEGSQKQFNWNEWGSISIKAIAYAGALTNNEQWIEAAVYAADSFIGDLMISGRAETISPNKKPYPLINYGTASNVDNMLALYNVTQDIKYAKLAGLIGSWWMGNNIMNVPMFNQNTGYAYDGMTATEVNINSGGESLAEAIRTLSRLLSIPQIEEYLYANTEDTFAAQVIEIEDLFRSSAPADTQKSLPNGMLNSPNQAIVIQQPHSGTNEQLIYNDAQEIVDFTMLYPDWYGKQTIFVAADGYNNMRLFDQGELYTTISIGEDEDQFQPGDYVKLDFAARVEFDTELSAEVFAINNEHEETLIANAENMVYHARTWYSGVNAVKTTPIAPIPEDAVELVVRFKVTSTKAPLYEGFAMVTEAKLYTMGVTEIRYGNTELSNSSYVELYPSINRTFNIEIPKNATYDIILSYIHENQANFNITIDQKNIKTVSLSNDTNGKVTVQNIGRVNLSAGEHQLTLSNLSQSTSAYLDAITFYPVTSYVSYTLATNDLMSIVRDATHEQLLLIEGKPIIAPIAESPNPSPTTNIEQNSNEFWTLQRQQLTTQEGVTRVTIPLNRTKLLLTIEDLTSTEELQLISNQFTITFNKNQLEQLKSLLHSQKQIVLHIAQSSSSSFDASVTPIITIEAYSIDDMGKKISTLPYSAQLIFHTIKDEKGLGLYVLTDNESLFYGIGKLQQQGWIVQLNHSGQYVGIVYNKVYDDMLDTHWAQEAIAALSSWHIINGFSDNKFRMRNNLTQAELLTMLVRISHLNKGINMTNATSGPWYQPYLEQAENKALLDITSFNPNEPMSRQHVVQWIGEFLERTGIHITESSAIDSGIRLDQFNDTYLLSTEHQSAWELLIQLGIIQGNEKKLLNPNQLITRAELSTILYKLIQSILETEKL